ncbi:MAG: site-specific integrase [Desulfovibrio sp.]|jgi:integrase|nr:site-specific integrase [Desulfovibrio sp.]
MAKSARSERVASKKYQGVYWRESSGRRHHGKPDRIYWIAFQAEGKLKWEKIGPASRGVTEGYCNRRRIEILNRMNLGEDPSSLSKRNIPTMDAVMSAYIDALKADGKTTRPLVSRYDVRAKPVLGGKSVTAVTPETLDAMKADLAGKLSAESVKKIFSDLRAAVNLAIRRKKFRGTNPFSTQGNFVMPRVQNRAERFLTPKEARGLLNELGRRSGQLHDMAFLSLHTGLRATEIFGLRGGDINAQNKSLTIRAKGGERQTVHLPPDALKMLLRRKTAPAALIFGGRNGKRPTAVSKTFAEAVNALGLNDGIEDARQKVWFHTLRHTFASWLAQSGEVGIQELMQLMRHKQIAMTLRYAHLLPDAGKEKMAIIGRTLAVRRPARRRAP